MVQGAAKEAGILRQMAVVAPNRTAVANPFALRLFYIWCEKRTTNPAPHSLRRARQWQWVISPSALVALTAVETPAPGPCCCSS